MYDNLCSLLPSSMQSNMSNPGKFADVIKAASDLLTKPFVADRKVSFKTVTDNKITVSGESVKESGANNKSITSSKLAFKFKATNVR